jgi:hypothetical protein
MIEKNIPQIFFMLGIPFRSDYVFGYLLTLRCECFSVQMGINDKRCWMYQIFLQIAPSEDLFRARNAFLGVKGIF